MNSGPAGSLTDRETLAAAYRYCRAVAAVHGRTYFLAARLLSPDRRVAVHALYAFARTVDDIVDHGAPDAAARLDDIETRLRIRLREAPHPDPDDPILSATADTVTRFGISPAHLRTFLDSMRMDVPGTTRFRNRYATMTELREYMAGSAAAIGLQLLPILGTVVPAAEAEPAAAALGEAFQLTNFLRDIAEDLDRDRIYLPLDELAVFGVDPDVLTHCRRTGHTDLRVRRALTHLIATNRALYRFATPGIDLLHPRVRPAIRTAAVLYAEILDRIEQSGYAVFRHRATVPRHRRYRVAATQFATAALHPTR
ncbi:phytoene/squalene synthase family protein [Nocardia sp. BMG111209]|uniref:phytoene/squalene synthase family protein n=1 Tax=Nocardia sp. BMG111209 TaxID=1160137 RepID=UPI000371987B|nr:phytoene/squalene synthase family protein [Nocardia sp. BMG111209]